MNLIQKVLLPSYVMILGACAQWPETGYGGFAESRIEHLTSTESDMPLQAEHGLRYDFTLLKNHLDILVLQGAAVCFPSIVYQTELREGRIARELRGQLYGDASADILIQRYHLARLERQLDLVIQSEECVTGLSSPPVEEAKASADLEISMEDLLRLLNSDNQFATDSWAINPKYQAQLTLAANYLREMLHFKIRIIGHADERGEAPLNQTLSEHRAAEVLFFLQTQGIPEERMQMLSMGSLFPLYQGSNVETLLVNRAVVIELESVL